MLPRNIRYIAPWKLAQIVSLLDAQFLYDSGPRNQHIQNQFTKSLEMAGIKKAGVQYDPHSGGARTYLAQLESLGLVFRRVKAGPFLTIAGQDMADGLPPLPILQELLFRHQYPSVYSHNANVRIHPSIRIKPFLFTLELIGIAGYLTQAELAVPVLYGHNEDCLELCLEKIYRIRRGEPLAGIIDSADDLYTPRTSTRSITAAIKDVGDIANTVKNYLSASCLVDVDSTGQQHRISLAPEYAATIRDAIASEMHRFINGAKSSPESYQRKFGAWNRTKDTRSLSAAAQRSPASAIITAQFFRYAGQSPIQGYPAEFIAEMTEGFGFEKSLVEETLAPLLPETLSYFESTYLEMAKSGGTKAIEFEKATGCLFEEKWQFNVMHTGQKKRPRKRGGYADLVLVATDDLNCAVIDTKSSPAYNISASDHRAMVNDYIPGCSELWSDARPRKLEFCAYIAGGFKGSIEHNLAEIRRTSGVPASAISAANFLALCKASPTQNDVRRLFSSGRELRSGQIQFS